MSPRDDRKPLDVGDTLAGLPLTPRQSEVAGLAILGLWNLKIADRLGLSEYAVMDHLMGIYVALGVSGRGELTVTGCSAWDRRAHSGRRAPPPSNLGFRGPPYFC